VGNELLLLDRTGIPSHQEYHRCRPPLPRRERLDLSSLEHIAEISAAAYVGHAQACILSLPRMRACGILDE
jgi:hypothetical protein